MIAVIQYELWLKHNIVLLQPNSNWKQQTSKISIVGFRWVEGQDEEYKWKSHWRCGDFTTCRTWIANSHSQKYFKIRYVLRA